MTHIMDLLLCLSCQFSDHIVRELNSLSFFQKFRCEFLGLQCCLHLCDDRKFINEPLVNLCNVVDHIIIHTSSAGLRNSPHTHIINDLQLLQEFVICQTGEIIGHQTVYMLLQ